MLSNDQDSGLLVIGAGCGGTESKTLKAALEVLYKKPCYDLTRIIQHHPDHVRKWIELDKRLTDESAEEGNSLDQTTVRAILNGYVCAVDFPTISYYWQLMHIYPNVKIVITETDPDGWLECLREIQQFRRNLEEQSSVKGLVDAAANGHAISQLLDRTCQRMFGQSIDYDDDQSVFDGLERWIRTGQIRIPKDRLLVFSPEEGWEPLCEFLELDVPNHPFPASQDREPLDLVPSISTTNESKRNWIILPVITLAIALGGIVIFLYRRR